MTGVLPVALNRACKLSGYFMHRDKTYVGIMHLHKNMIIKKLQEVIDKEFVGKIKQLPPKRSKVKRQEREREVKKFELLEKKGKDVLFLVEVEAGTYIRKLCLHPNTEMITPNGLIKIKDFFQKPSEIYSFNKEKLELKKPSETQQIPILTKMIQLKMASGIDLITTPDHKMLVSKNNGYEMIESQNLKEGDYLVKSNFFPINTINYSIPDLLDDDYFIEQHEIKNLCKKAMIEKFGSIREMNRKLKLDRKAFFSNSKYAISIKHLKLSGIYDRVKANLKKFKTPKGKVIKIDKLTSDHFYLLGLISSDGNNTREKKTKRFTRLKFHNINKELINIFYNLYKQLFPSIEISKRLVRDNLFQLDTSNSLFASIAANLGIVSPNKYSDICPILYCKNEFIKSFLKGYFDGDGTAYIKKKKNSTTTYSKISFFSVNYINAKRVHQMLLKLNINSKIFLRKKYGIYVVDINSIPSKKKFIEEIGANHPRKKAILEEINKIANDNIIGDENYIGFHYKDSIRRNKSKLHKMGGNLNRILRSNAPLTKGFYRKCSGIIELPKLGDFIIEKVEKVEVINSTEQEVFDMTIPETHNFLIETGFISSNCSDLGQKIGGAHMIELRRIRAGIFSEKDKNFVNLYDFQKAVGEYKKGKEEKLREILIPAEIISEMLPVVQVKEEAVSKLLTGKPIFKRDLEEPEEILKISEGKTFVVFFKDKFIEVARQTEEETGDIIARPEFVFN